MKVQLKMFGDLRQYLPVGNQFNRCEVELEGNASLADLLGGITLPEAKTCLVMKNGELILVQDHSSTSLQDQDEVVIFPPVKGG